MFDKLWIVICLIAVTVVGYAINRDMNLIEHPVGDLRNRVAGARLQKDGYIPYIYEWQNGDEKKYFDSEGDYSSVINEITATPFFHILLYPLVNFSIVNIFRIWTAFQYVMLLCMGFICWKFAQTSLQKKLVIITCILLFFTEAWMNSVVSGQLYLLIPFLLGTFLFCLWKNKAFYAFIAGLCAISLVLVRPNAAFVFLPFLFLLRITNFRQLGLFMIAPAMFTLYILGNEHQRNLWIEYKIIVSAHAKAHQINGPELQKIIKGQDNTDKNKANVRGGRVFYSENGNFFVLVRNITGIKLSVAFLILTTFIFIGVLLFLFLKSDACNSRSIYIYCIFGACLYMISDLLSPIHRHQYYTVQWFLSLLLAAALYRKRLSGIYVILTTGLFLNIVNTTLIKMEHTLGEYLWLVALLILVFKYNSNTNNQTQNRFKPTSC